jgi:hypothetical protein
MHIQINDACILIINMKRVAGIEPASLAWKARGYSRRRFTILNASNSKPNMKLWFHSAPLWKMDRFLDLRRKRNYKKKRKHLRCMEKGSYSKFEFKEKKIRSITSMSAFLSECIQNDLLSR